MTDTTLQEDFTVVLKLVAEAMTIQANALVSVINALTTLEGYYAVLNKQLHDVTELASTQQKEVNEVMIEMAKLATKLVEKHG